MCEFLDNFIFEDADDGTLKGLIRSVTSFLTKAEEHLTTAKFNVSSQNVEIAEDEKEEKEEGNVPNIQYMEPVLEESMMRRLKKELAQLSYTSTGTKKPGVCLFGGERYVYSKSTADLEPQPLASTVISDVLDVVNMKLNMDYNSVLVNRYANKNVGLGWHQDNEDSIDQTRSIATLSVGATRRFWLADDNKRDEYVLEENSALVMRPGLQITHFHRVCCGTATANQRGVRYSLTFRRLLPSVSTPDQESPETPSSPHTASEHKDCLKGLVFGSSLTKGLKEHLLSRRGKNFGVFTNSGAHVDGVMQDVLREAIKGDICRKCVDTVFFVCGGNDVENRRLHGFTESYEKLVDYASYIFPNAGIKVVSLLPRRLRYSNHLSDILRANDALSTICEARENCRYINIFSYYIKDRKNFFDSNCKEMVLNSKLFSKDSLHFNYKGNSVLGKVLIAVTYNPR